MSSDIRTEMTGREGPLPATSTAFQAKDQRLLLRARPLMAGVCPVNSYQLLRPPEVSLPIPSPLKKAPRIFRHWWRDFAQALIWYSMEGPMKERRCFGP